MGIADMGGDLGGEKKNPEKRRREERNRRSALQKLHLS
jgi:hypothetical protein